MKVGNVFENPLFYFKAYTLRNAAVVEALENGCFDEWCPQCRGTGTILLRPSACVTDRPPGKPQLPNTHGGSEGCRRCRKRCPSCRGRRLCPDTRTVCAQDFLDEDDMRTAERLIPGITLTDDFNERQLR